jgi:hypothetical protein
MTSFPIDPPFSEQFLFRVEHSSARTELIYCEIAYCAARIGTHPIDAQELCEKSQARINHGLDKLVVLARSRVKSPSDASPGQFQPA